MQFQAKATQRETRLEAFRIVSANVDATPSALTTEMPEGYTRAVVSVSSHVFTLTFNQPFARAPVVSILPVQSGSGVSFIPNLASVTASAITWRCEDDASSGAADPTGFHVIVMGFDSADVI